MPKTPIVDDLQSKTVMVPDSTTESLSASSSSTKLDKMSQESRETNFAIKTLQPLLSRLPFLESLVHPSKESPNSVVNSTSKSTSNFSKSKSPLKPSQTSPTIFKALTDKLPPIESDLEILEQANRDRLSSADPLPDLLSNTSARDKSRRRSVEDKGKSTESDSTPIVTGRRKVCQTDFYQVIYPEPKRRKSADTARPSVKAKPAKACDTIGAATSKGWRGKSNILPSLNGDTDSPPTVSTSKSANEEKTTEGQCDTPCTTTKEKVSDCPILTITSLHVLCTTCMNSLYPSLCLLCTMYSVLLCIFASSLSLFVI